MNNKLSKYKKQKHPVLHIVAIYLEVPRVHISLNLYYVPRTIMLKIQRDWSRTIFTLWTPLCLQTHNIIPQKMFCSHIKMTKEDNRSIDTLNLIASCSMTGSLSLKSCPTQHQDVSEVGSGLNDISCVNH